MTEQPTHTEESDWIVKNLPLPDDGTFVEVGAFDGFHNSNTIMFERMGWRGIVIEADPLNAWKCVENRKCWVICAAVGIPPKNVISRFIINRTDRGLSGLSRFSGMDCSDIFIPIITLENILLRAMPEPKIDLLSIDTEGTELEVWRSIGDCRPKIVICEWNTSGIDPEPKRILDGFEKDGYKKVFENNVNFIFTRE